MGRDSLWYKDAIIYQLHVRTFFDANGDGVGDFRGLAEKLDYFTRLGVTCLWLLPFNPSPLRDDGYDIADYRNVNPAYGSLADFRTFVAAAHARGIRVVTELVLNHTSDQHPWFQEARNAPRGSAARERYVWSDTTDRYRDARVIFSDSEDSNWTWDAAAGAYYWHRFYRHQPDLNYDNPVVRREMADVMRFWLDLGVDGLRLDAVAHLFEREGTSCEGLPETHAFLKELRAIVDAEYPGRVLIAEVNQRPDRLREYFGDGDECHMAFHFPMVAPLFLALSRQVASPVVDAARAMPDIPGSAQWATFLRNHDELSLSALPNADRSALLNTLAPHPSMRLNGDGIRRRLGPLLDNDRRRIELAHALLFSLPGTPVLYYGDEIALRDDVGLPDRDGLRLAMAWDVERAAASLRDRIARLIAARRRHPPFGRGATEFVDTGNPHVLAFLRRHADADVLVVANLAATPQGATLGPLARGVLTIAPYGYGFFPSGRNSSFSLPSALSAGVPANHLGIGDLPGG
jgi:maltose alpha-D-glucosyltransferase/alpha-amylase